VTLGINNCYLQRPGTITCRLEISDFFRGDTSFSLTLDSAAFFKKAELRSGWIWGHHLVEVLSMYICIVVYQSEGWHCVTCKERTSVCCVKTFEWRSDSVLRKRLMYLLLCIRCQLPCDNSLLRVCCSLVDPFGTRVYVRVPVTYFSCATALMFRPGFGLLSHPLAFTTGG
jgi:hypothetical protein